MNRNQIRRALEDRSQKLGATLTEPGFDYILVDDAFDIVTGVLGSDPPDRDVIVAQIASDLWTSGNASNKAGSRIAADQLLVRLAAMGALKPELR